MTSETKSQGWTGDVLVARDGTLMTVYPNGVLELRGKGWEGRKRKGDTPNTDRPRDIDRDVTAARNILASASPAGRVALAA